MNYIIARSTNLLLKQWQEKRENQLSSILFILITEMFDRISMQQSEIYWLRSRCEDLEQVNQELMYAPSIWSDEGKANCDWDDNS